MTKLVMDRSSRWVLLLCLLLPLPCAAEQFVELTAEIEVNDWSYWFFEDQHGLPDASGYPRTIFPQSTNVRVVVGANTWMMEGDFYANAKATRWFTGTNIVERLVLAQPAPEATMRVKATGDGNPGEPVQVSDLMDTTSKICWLAFCSGPALKRGERHLYPVSDLWKELIYAPSGFTDKITVFQDGLNLPRSVSLLTPKDELVTQYQVRDSTNVLGWSFPLEFYLVQYRPARWPRTNSWELHLTAKGKLTAIGAGEQPQLPTETQESHAK
jgi:hypothetical protein